MEVGRVRLDQPGSRLDRVQGSPVSSGDRTMRRGCSVRPMRGPGVWTAVGDAVEQVEIPLPERFDVRSFLDVASTGPRYVALIGARGLNTSAGTWSCQMTWSIGGLGSMPPVTRWPSWAPGDGSLIGWRALAGQMLGTGRRIGGRAQRVRRPGGDRMRLPFIGAMATAGGVTVVGGVTTAACRCWCGAWPAARCRLPFHCGLTAGW
jgi:hypothetical protein